jgi:hypothetical protein
MYAHGLLAPVLALAAWTFVMWVWMYAVRIPAMRKARTDLREAERTGVLDLPRAAQRPAENYNHLHEQPTVFYAVALAAQIGGAADTINIGLAWAYVALRVVHSLVQATANIIIVRFWIFVTASLALAALLARTIVALIG